MVTAGMRLPALPLSALRCARREALLTLLMALGAFLLAGAIVMDFGARGRAFGNFPLRMPATDRDNAAAVSALPAPRVVGPEEARAINAALPLSGFPNPAALPFVLTTSNALDRERATDCLATAIYYEAAAEPLDGQRAVAQVVLNRLRDPAFPKSVCAVVYQGSGRATGCQFTFTCDGSLARAPIASYWNRARQVAEQALAGSVYQPVGWATHYHANWVVPYWSSSLVKVAAVGSHIFYRWNGGRRTDLLRYAGMEPDISRMRAAAMVNSAAAVMPRGGLTASAPSLADVGPVTGSGQLFGTAFSSRALGSGNGSARVPASETGRRAAAVNGLRWRLGGAGGESLGGVDDAGGSKANRTEGEQ